jgi:glycosyltransferase involved in cell wall biosynthesis
VSRSISVVIPVRNDAKMLQSCLGALAGQTRQAEEIVVVDNGSSDASAAIATAAGARLISEPHRGIPFAASAGYDAARGDLIARIDADTVVPGNWLAQAERTFDRDPDLAVLTGGATFYGSSELVHRLGERLYVGGMYWSMTAYLGHPPIFGSNFAMRKEVWQTLRDEVHVESGIHDDLDLSLHIRPGMHIEYDPSWSVAISARPFATASGLVRRVAWVVPTLRNHEGPLARRAAWRSAEEDAEREALA